MLEAWFLSGYLRSKGEITGFMDSLALLQALQQISPITDGAWNSLSQLFEPIELRRNEYLVRQGARASHAYILLDGVVRVFYSQERNEYNKNFFVPGMFPTPLTALISGEPCAISFQALVPCRLIRFSFEAFQALFQEHRCLETLMRRILEQVWIDKERHDIRMVTNDATTNYLIFQKEFPGLETRIPQYHIASYLGITPIQLSRIRAKLAQPSSH